MSTHLDNPAKIDTLQMQSIRFRIEMLMTDAITISRNEGNSAWGPIDGETVDENWGLELASKAVTDPKGEEVVADVTGIGPYNTVVAVGDLMTWNDVNYRVINVRPISLFSLVSHVEADFKAACDGEQL